MVTFSMVTFSTLHPSFHHRSTLAPPASHHPSITFTQPLQPYPSLPPTLPPTPFHLLHPLSASFSFVGGERGGQEAVEKRRGKAQRIPRGGADIATCRKAMKSIHFTLRARKNALARPMLYNGAAVLGACLKRTIPTNIGNSFKEKLEGNWSLQANFRRNRKREVQLEFKIFSKRTCAQRPG